jgi:hypothetical protein
VFEYDRLDYSSGYVAVNSACRIIRFITIRHEKWRHCGRETDFDVGVWPFIIAGQAVVEL